MKGDCMYINIGMVVNEKMNKCKYDSFSLEELEWLYEYKYRIVVNNGGIECLVYEKNNIEE